MTRIRASLTALLLAATIVSPATEALAQRGGGGGGGGDLDAPAPTGRDLPPTSRLDILAVSLGLTKDQKNTAKALMDDAGKTAGPIRAKLTSTRAALGTAVQTGQSQENVTAALKAHAVAITEMTSLEMTTLARVLDLLTPDQRAAVQARGIRAPFYLFRGAFLEQKWNTEPEQAGY